MRLQGFVGAHANIAAADLSYEDFSEEVGPVKAEFLLASLAENAYEKSLSSQGPAPEDLVEVGSEQRTGAKCLPQPLRL